MAKTRQLLRREITYESAKEKEVNILHQLGYHDKQTKFFSQLSDHHEWIGSIVAHHLNLHSLTFCQVADINEWLHGSFNVCIPVTINNDKGSKKRVLLRIPLPYRVGEEFMPGNGGEKVQCEAGAYAWLQENCPDVPIPRLHGFALSTGETVELCIGPVRCLADHVCLVYSYRESTVPTWVDETRSASGLVLVRAVYPFSICASPS